MIIFHPLAFFSVQFLSVYIYLVIFFGYFLIILFVKITKTSEHDEIFNSLEPKNLYDSATKTTNTKQPLKLTNYNLSPSHLSASFRDIYKSERNKITSIFLLYYLRVGKQ